MEDFRNIKITINSGGNVSLSNLNVAGQSDQRSTKIGLLDSTASSNPDIHGSRRGTEANEANMATVMDLMWFWDLAASLRSTFSHITSIVCKHIGSILGTVAIFPVISLSSGMSVNPVPLQDGITAKTSLLQTLGTTIYSVLSNLSRRSILARIPVPPEFEVWGDEDLINGQSWACSTFIMARKSFLEVAGSTVTPTLLVGMITRLEPFLNELEPRQAQCFRNSLGQAKDIAEDFLRLNAELINGIEASINQRNCELLALIEDTKSWAREAENASSLFGWIVRFYYWMTRLFASRPRPSVDGLVGRLLDVIEVVKEERETQQHELVKLVNTLEHANSVCSIPSALNSFQGRAGSPNSVRLVGNEAVAGVMCSATKSSILKGASFSDSMDEITEHLLLLQPGIRGWQYIATFTTPRATATRIIGQIQLVRYQLWKMRKLVEDLATD